MEILIILVLTLTVLVFINMIMLTRYHNKVTKLDEDFKQRHDIIYNVCIECRSFLKKVQDLKFVTNFNDVDKALKELKPMIKNITNVIDGLGIKNLKEDIKSVLSNQKVDSCKLNDILKTLDVELSIIRHIENCLIAFTTDGSDAKLKHLIEEINAIINKHNAHIDSKLSANNYGVTTLDNKAKEIKDLLDKVNSHQTDDFVINKNNINEIKKYIAEIGSVIDSIREKVNYIETYILNNTKPKTASKTKMVQTKTAATPVSKKGVQKYL